MVRDPVEGQIEAYNARDIEAFVKNYAEDVEVWTLGATEPSIRGQAAFRARFTELFASAPELHVNVVNRTRIGAYVFDEEKVTGVPGRPLIHTMVINYVE